MPVQRIRIRGFKALADVTLELGWLNVFIGPNGAGKTSLLEGIGLLSAAMAGRVDDEALMRRGVRLGQPAVYKTALRQTPVPRVIRLEAEGEAFLYRVSLDNPVDEPQKAWRFAHEWLGRPGETQPLLGRSPRSDLDPAQGRIAMAALPEPARRLREALRMFRIFTPHTPVLRGIAPDPAPQAPLGLAGGGLAEAVTELLRHPDLSRVLRATLQEWFDWVEDVTVLPASELPVPPALPMTQRVLVFTDRYARPPRNRMTAYDASEGVLHALFLAVLVLHPRTPPLVAVDNAGYGLHPRLKRVLVRQLAQWLLQQRQRQLLLTTHDPLMLDGLPLWDDGVRLFVVARNAEGAVEVHRVQITEDLWRLKEERGWVLSDLWVEGWLGGVPGLG